MHTRGGRRDSLLEIEMMCVDDYELKPPINEKFIMNTKYKCTNGIENRLMNLN
jgi:hypothetical protein